MAVPPNDGEVRHYPAGSLPLGPDATGAHFWAVALRRVMLTYFEIPPGVRFDEHHHESEQITWVLEGELFFEVHGRTIPVEAGGVIAIPANAPHAVFTRQRAARAADAWSPVPERYRPADEA